MAWRVVQTHPQREIAASIAVVSEGFQAFCPLYNSERIRFGKIENVIGPLFPRYIFTKFDAEHDDWGVLKSTKWVSWVLASPEGKPFSIPDAIITEIRNRDMSRKKEPEQQTFTQNQRLRIQDGPFAGLEGIFQASAKDRVTLLLDLLGKTPVEIPITNVVAA